uniref:Upstream transcription factor family member 3 n=1 Tax=Callorhinchus milii TaxID=7868 RepID=A0A4W3JN30_CALMI|eukprot:gi/632949244/ref/XP_007890038.1/ PREDICTED: basic helix-loop-helix domain-containing protein KIAA2018 homolog [Callorhinchus milii]
MPEMTENQTPMHRTHRKKNRETHNAVERHRKKKINTGINKIGELIPCSPALKQSKNMILDQAFKYISDLKKQNDELLLNGGTKEQSEEIKRLRKQLDELQKENGRYMELLKANDICLYDDPTIHWKGKLKNAKVTMVISSNQMQEDILVYSDGNQLNSNCQEAVIQNLYNVNPSLPEESMNILPGQKNNLSETSLDIIVPVAVPNICPLENNAPVQTAQISQQEVTKCLPTTRSSQTDVPCTTSSTVQSVLNIPLNNTGEMELQCPPSSCPTSCSSQILECSKGKFGQSDLEAANSSSTQSTDVSRSTCFALTLQSQQTDTSCASLDNSNTTQEPAFGSLPHASSSQDAVFGSTRLSIMECSQNLLGLNIGKSTPLSTSSLVAPSQSFKAGAISNTGVMPSCPIASSWTVSCSASTNVGTSDSNSVSTFTRMASSGNTRTTWTTLQLEGNTVLPMSQVGCSIVPTSLSDDVNTRNSFSFSESGPSNNNVSVVPSSSSATLNGVSLCPVYKPQLKQPVAVTVPSVQPLPLQPIPPQPQIPAQSATKVVSLLPPLQVIQMAHASVPSVSSTPGNQNLIILQPANPSSPAVVRGGISSHTPGQQIVIIQAASQNAVSVVPAQANNRVPILDTNQVVCSSNNVQSTSSVQTVGGKHLVHILPRPVSSSASANSQSFSSPQQQTISVNGQLFALQPVKQSGISTQNPMQIIQPTTSADPNTNVALKTFGALTNLNKSISQMAGQGCLQIASTQIPNPPATVNTQMSSVSNCVADTTVVNISTDILRTSLNSATLHQAWPTTNSSLKSSLGVSSNCKSKKVQKKPLSSKLSATKKVTNIGNKSKTSPSRPEFIKSNSKDNPSQLLTSEDHVLSQKSLTISQPSSVSQILTSVTSTVNLSTTTSTDILDTQQMPKLSEGFSQNVAACLAEPASLSVPVEPGTESSIVTEMIVTSVLDDSLPPASSQDELAKIVSSADCSPCVITGVSTSLPASLSYCSNASLEVSETFTMDKNNSLIELQTAVENACNTSVVTSDTSQLESFTESQQKRSKTEEVRTQDWNKERLEISNYLMNKEIPNQEDCDTISGVTHSDKPSSTQKNSSLSVLKDSCSSNELSVDNSKQTPSSMLFYEKDEHQKDVLLASTEGETVAQHHLCNPDQESIGNSLIINRQTESPMSTSSGSSRGFSVASMLPDTTREDASCTMTSTLNNCSLSEQNDIVALAARAIFEHESPGKSIITDVTVCDMQSKAQRASSAEKESCRSQQPAKSLGDKVRTNLIEAGSVEGQAHRSLLLDISIPGTSLSKNSTVAKQTPSTSLISTSSSASVTASLSVINLVCHSEANQIHVCSSGLTQPAEQLPVCVTASLSSRSSSYTAQSSEPTLLVEYSHEQLNSIKGTVQASQVQGAHLKQSNNIRKDATKRIVTDDHLISTPKRQKQCTSITSRLEGKTTLNTLPEIIPECGQSFISQLASNSSTSLVSSSSPGHMDSLSTLFPPTNFLSSNPVGTLRQIETHCSVQPSIQETQGLQSRQQLQQHMVSQQNISSQAGLNLHHSHTYYKHHQGQMRERNLYQFQHHLSQAEPSIQQQTHRVQQSRTTQQDVQMQKKRGLIRGNPTPQLPLQQKTHPGGNDQGRQKGNHHHHQHIQQQMQHSHFGNSHQEKGCDNSITNRNHHSSHTQNLHGQDLLHQQQHHDNGSNRQQGSGVSLEPVSGQSRIQRLMSSRSLEQQMDAKTNPVSRHSDIQCAPHRQERNRVSSYSAEALIGKTPSSTESRMTMTVQPSRNNLEPSEMRTYLDLSMSKSMPVHNLQTKLSMDHTMNTDVQGLSDCSPFKVSVTSQAVGTFEVQNSRNNEIVSTVPSHRGMQSHGFRLGQNSGAERQPRLPYLPMQGITSGSGVSLRENDGSCPQSFMQGLLPPHLSEQMSGNQRAMSEHSRNNQCGPPGSIEYNCPPIRESVHLRREGEMQNHDSCDMNLVTLSSRNSTLSISYSNPSVGEIQGRNISPNVAAQKNSLRMNETQGNKCNPNVQGSTNMHGAVRSVLSHPAVPHGSNGQGHSIQPPNSVSQRTRHQTQDGPGSKMRQTERSRSGNHRTGNVFAHGLQLPLTSNSGMILGRQQPQAARTGSIVRFMAEGQQVPNDNLTPDQHSLPQNFGFPFIPESSMNSPMNANTSFIPPVTQPGSTRTPALIPVEPQNTLPSFYPPYSPAHPNLSNDISIPYFSNQIFTSPSTEKANGGGLNNPFGSILSPPRPVGFPQSSFPLLPDIPPRPMANTSSITPHLSNFNLTTLFPEIATAPLAPEGSAMPMSPLLPLTNPAISDISKQHQNRSAHNISHILGHDGNSAV